MPGVGGSSGGEAGGGGAGSFPGCGVGGGGVASAVDGGCLECAAPSAGGWGTSASAWAFAPDKGCFSPSNTPLCAVCGGDGACPDAGLAPGGHCIVGPGMEAYYVVTQPRIWTVAPGWCVSDALVGTSDKGAGTPTPAQTALCAQVKAIVIGVAPGDGGMLDFSAPPVACK
jgi:hypothetical protein